MSNTQLELQLAFMLRACGECKLYSGGFQENLTYACVRTCRSNIGE